MRLASGALAAALAGLIAGPGAAQAAPGDLGRDLPFPARATSQPSVQAWIDRYLPAKGYVVGAWSPNVVMLVSTTEVQVDAYPEVATEVWSEVTNAKAAKAAGWRAMLALQVFDCARNQYRTHSSLVFERADREGGFDTEDGDDVWRTPDEGTTMDTVERAACFYGRKLHDAAAAKAPPAATPKP